MKFIINNNNNSNTCILSQKIGKSITRKKKTKHKIL